MWKSGSRTCRWRILSGSLATAAVLTAVLALRPVSARDAEPRSAHSVSTARDIRIGAVLVREYGELMASAKVALPQSDDPQWGPVGNQLALERARQLERSKLGAEMRLLELQLACAADDGRSMPRDLRADLVSSIENLRGLQASCEPVGSTGSPQDEEVPR